MSADRLYLRGKIYWCWFYDTFGRQIRKSTKCRDRRAAEVVLKRYERDTQGAAHPAENAPAYTVDDAVNDFVEHGCLDVSDETVRMYEERGGHVVRLLGSHDVHAVTVDVVKGYIRERLDDGAARETIRKELTTLRQSLACAKEAGKFFGEPRAVFPKFRVTYVPRDRWLTKEEFKKLLAELEPHRQLWLVVAVYTGGRDSEVDALRWEFVDWTAKTVLLTGTKTAKARRRVPLHPILSAVLTKERQKLGHIVGEWMNVRRDLERACDRAKIDPVTPNDLRRTFASWLKQDGVDSAVVARLLGHASTKMVDLVYGRIDDATLQRAIQSLPGGCDNSVIEANARRGSNGKRAKKITVEETLTSVLGPGIEPGTRGFSIRSSSAPDRRMHKRKQARRQLSQQVRDNSVIGPRLRIVRGCASMTTGGTRA